MDLKVTVGRGFEAKSGVDVSISHDDHVAEEVRSRVTCEPSDIVVSLGLTLKPDADGTGGGGAFYQR